MKRCLIAVALLAALVLTACAQADTATDNSYQGKVVAVHVSKAGNVFLNFGGQYPNQTFSGFVRAKSVEDCGGLIFLQSLDGKIVKLTGKVQDYQGKPEIVLVYKAQITVVSGD